MTDSDLARQKVFDYVLNMMGQNMIDVELDPSHLNTALDRALRKYRQRSSNAVEESFAFLTLAQNQNDYFMPEEVENVRVIYRRSVGSRTGGGDGGSLFEPFNLAYSNTYLLSSTNMGGLATYYAFASYQKQVGKMFGSYINFIFNKTSKKLTIDQRPQSNEEVLLWIDNYRPDFTLLADRYAQQWLYDYTLATSKIMVGEAREKFNTIASPSGGVSLNGATLKTEGATMIKELEEDLVAYREGGSPLSFIIG